MNKLSINTVLGAFTAKNPALRRSYFLNVNNGLNGPGPNIAVRPSDSPKFLSTLYSDIDQAEAKEKKKKNGDKDKAKDKAAREQEEFLKRIYDMPETQATS